MLHKPNFRFKRKKNEKTPYELALEGVRKYKGRFVKFFFSDKLYDSWDPVYNLDKRQWRRLARKKESFVKAKGRKSHGNAIMFLAKQIELTLEYTHFYKTEPKFGTWLEYIRR